MDVGKVTVTENLSVRIVLLQAAQQGDEGCLLLLGAGVGRTALLIQASLIADADGVLVVVAGMGTGKVLMTRLVQLTAAGDVVMVAGETETSSMAGDEGGDRETAVAAGGAAVNDD